MNNFKTIKNRRATYDFQIIDTYEAGMVLLGTEVKSLRDGNAHINDAFCQIKKGEMYLINMYIDEYKFGNLNNHNTVRERKLLLNKRELKQIGKKIAEKGFTVIPLKIFLSERGLLKIAIATAKGKKTHDKRDSIKSKDIKRDTDRAVRNYKF